MRRGAGGRASAGRGCGAAARRPGSAEVVFGGTEHITPHTGPCDDAAAGAVRLLVAPADRVFEQRGYCSQSRRWGTARGAAART